MDEILRNHQQALVDEQKKLQQLLSPYMENENVNVHWRNICDLYDTKIKNIQPEIMVYGIYNAGKSSILNELIGEDKARVADIPTTDSVIYYDWNGYRIADTPGIMAPIQHQNVTQEHLKKADVVLFVMSTTGSNEKRENYVRMKEISDAGKKIIIVLNDKNGDLNSGDQARESALQLIKIQVANHMKQVGIKDIDSKYCIVVVNAERSRKGRIGNKENMIIKSNFNELKKVMLSELKRTTSFDILRNAITEIEKSLLAIIQCLETSNQSTSSKELNRILETLQEQKINIRKEIHLYIQQKSQSMGQRLPILIWEHRNNQEKLNEVMGKEIDILIQKVQGKTELLLKDMAGMMQQEIAEVSERMASMDMHGVHEITVNQEGMNALEEEQKQFSSKKQDTMLSSFRSIIEELEKNPPILYSSNQSKSKSGTDELAKAVSAGVGADLVVKGTSEVIGNLAKTEMGKALAKTAAGKALGSIAGSLVPVIGPVITVVSTLDLLGKILGDNGKEREALEEQVARKNELQRRQMEAEAQARQELQQKCHYLAEDLSDQLSLNMEHIISDIFQQYEQPCKDEIKKNNNAFHEHMKDLVSLRDIYQSYEKIRLELGA